MSDVFDSDVSLGEQYRDSMSGFEGVATAVHFYMHGCERVQLESYDAVRQEIREAIFDAPRLVHIESGLMLKETDVGGFKPAPPRRGVR